MATFKIQIDHIGSLSEGDLASFLAEALAISAERGREQWEANFRALDGRLGSTDKDEVKAVLAEWAGE
jgi:hypothetical protein